MPLENAPQHVQLAVDLIELLETNNIKNTVAVAALELVLADFQAKLEDEKGYGISELRDNRQSIDHTLKGLLEYGRLSISS